MNTLVFTTC